jgi:hypothetical protein
MQIQTSLDWHDAQTELRARLGNVPYNPDLWRMLVNIGNMVTSLSQVEVEARRKNLAHITEPKVLAINQAIDHFEKLLLIAELMK